MELTVDLGKLVLKNPILTASGTFGYGLEFADFYSLDVLGGIVVKGLSLEPRQGNPEPRLVETPCGLLNAIGLQNIGAKAFIRDILPLLPWDKTSVIVNMYARSVEEFSRLASMLAAAEGVAALEVNISCPNVQKGGLLFGQDPFQSQEVTQAVKANAGQKAVIVKLSPNVTDIVTIAQAVEQGGADCISLINTLGGMAVDVKTRRPSLGNVFGGLSGPAIKPVALKMVYQVCQSVKVPVIGIGGITSAEDVLEFILVGAHAVQVGSANFLRPDICKKIIDELKKQVVALGLAGWEGFRGKLLLD